MNYLSCMDKTLYLRDNDLNLTATNIPEDVFSIVDALNNKEKIRNVKNYQSNKCIPYLLSNFDIINYWIDRNLYPAVLMMEPGLLYEIIKSMFNLKKRIDILLKTIRDRKKCKHRFSEFSCVDCNYVINSMGPMSKGNFQHIIESHDHIAMKLFYNEERSKILREVDELEIVNSSQFIKDQSNETKQVVKSLTIAPEKDSRVQLMGVKQIKFEYTYLPIVLDTLYPPSLMQVVERNQNNHPLYTIQLVTPSQYDCLICRVTFCSITETLGHATTKYHHKMLKQKKITSAGFSYHELFASMPYEWQIHQVFYYPCSHSKNKVTCKLCGNDVLINTLSTHTMCIKYAEEMGNIVCAPRFSFFKELRDAGELKIPKSTVHIKESTQKSIIFNNSNSAAIPMQVITNSTMMKGVSSTLDEVNTEDSDDSVIIEFEQEYKQENATIALLTEEESEENTDNQDISDEDENEDVDSEESKELSSEPGTSQEHQYKKDILKEKKQAKKGVDERILHKIIVSVKPNPKDLIEFLPNRFHLNRKYLIETDRNVYCTLCLKTFSNLLKKIIGHCTSFEHQKLTKQNSKRYQYKYYCDICQSSVTREDKWQSHMNTTQHKSRWQGINDKQNYNEYECTTCRDVLFGNLGTIMKHEDNSNLTARKTKKAAQKLKLQPSIEKMLNSDVLLTEEIKKLCAESDKVLESRNIVNMCCKAFEKALIHVYPNCRAYPFGSRVSGLGNMGSDLDIFIDVGDMFFGEKYQDAQNQIDIVNLTAETLKVNKNFLDIFTIPSARTPIVQVFHRGTNLDCDLSFRHGLSVENTEYLKFNIKLQPCLRELILFLKRWSKAHKLREKITTYAMAMLAIYYLQVKNFLPSVSLLRKIDSTNPNIIAGWESFSYKPTELVEVYKSVKICEMPIKDTLIGFFKFYSNFKFSTEVVCPLLGYSVNKINFSKNGYLLPIEMKTYVTKVTENEEPEVFRSQSPMCVQDPFDLSHNLTKACSEALLRRFVNLCQLSHSAL